jgi:hypothetical protein
VSSRLFSAILEQRVTERRERTEKGEKGRRKKQEEERDVCVSCVSDRYSPIISSLTFTNATSLSALTTAIIGVK